jgi:hypothetical protein
MRVRFRASCRSQEAGYLTLTSAAQNANAFKPVPILSNFCAVIEHQCPMVYRGGEAMAKLAAARVCLCGAGGLVPGGRARAAGGAAASGHRPGPRGGTQRGDAGLHLRGRLRAQSGRAQGPSLSRRGTDIEAVSKELVAGTRRSSSRTWTSWSTGSTTRPRAVAEACREEKWACLHVGLDAPDAMRQESWHTSAFRLESRLSPSSSVQNIIGSSSLLPPVGS